MANRLVTKRVTIVSFNENERAAVDRLLDEIAPGFPSPWGRSGERALTLRTLDEEWRLEHIATQAQGNVIAGAQLASQFASMRTRPDYVVFYGCAGAIRRVHVGTGFLVQRADYLSLGTVDEISGTERVTLKNKWLCELEPSDASTVRLPSVQFPLAAGTAALDLTRLMGIRAAQVVATDKVIKIGPGKAPQPVVRMPSVRYAKEEWSYGTALALWAGSTDPPVLVEMESYGIGLLANALNLTDRIVVLRIATDDLKSHSSSDDEQRELLLEGRALLGRVLAILFNPGGFQP